MNQAQAVESSEAVNPSTGGEVEPALVRSTGEDRSVMTPEAVQEAAQLDAEIAAAMSGMAPADLAELCSGAHTSAGSGATPLDSATVEPGTALVGTVVGFSDDEVFLEFDAKSQGILLRSQFGKKEVIDIGRRVDVVVDRYDSDSGMLAVSRKGAVQRATWTNLAVGMIVEGKVTGLNKGGLEVDLKGVRAFMPGSQVDLFPMRDISVLIGQSVRAEVIELDRKHKNVLVSRRKLLEQERAETREKLKAEIQVGQVRKGVVGNLAEFGAFVDLGGMDGLIHIRDLSWGVVENVSDVLKPGQEVEVKILKIDGKRDRISLGLKQALPDPWVHVSDRFPAGAALKARVVRIADFGAFAEVEPGIEGLIPVSEMAWHRVNSCSEVVSVGGMVDVKVIRVEAEKRRMALSMKQALPDPWDGILESFVPQSMVKGTVTRLANFGAFVQIAAGVEGLIHISELSDRRVKSAKEVVDVGNEVEVRVLGIDRENRRISLSMKPAYDASAAKAESAGEASKVEPAAKSKKRKKPLRGGLSWEW